MCIEACRAPCRALLTTPRALRPLHQVTELEWELARAVAEKEEAAERAQHELATAQQRHHAEAESNRWVHQGPQQLSGISEVCWASWPAWCTSRQGLLIGDNAMLSTTACFYLLMVVVASQRTSQQQGPAMQALPRHKSSGLATPASGLTN
jgi:hypothetical protein